MAGFKRATIRKTAEVDVPQIFPLNRIEGTDQQIAIWREMVYGTKHLVVDARAGVGKTFSGLHGLALMQEMDRLPKSVGFCAFTKAVGLELQKKVPENVRAGTMHSFGFSAIRYTNRDVKVEGSKLDYLLERLVNTETFPRYLRSAITKLAGLCKNTLTGEVEANRGVWHYEVEWDELDELCNKYAIEVEDEDKKDVFELVGGLLEVSLNDEKRIDFDDMIWLPVVKDIRCWKNDLLIVDEVQDLNKTQQKLMMKMGKRIMVVGDPYQAIFGFRGADSDSFNNTRNMLGDFTELPLTKTRRCPKSHVEAVQHLVPDFEAMDDAPEGRILWEEMEQTVRGMQPEDMVLCRTNAPLISTAFTLLRMKRRVKVLGRDIGKNLMSFIEKLGTGTKGKKKIDRPVGGILVRLQEYKDREEAKLLRKKYGVSDKLIALDDKVQCARAFLAEADNLAEVRTNMRDMFGEQGEDGLEDAVILSSIHKAKGLEARTIRILRPDLLPHPAAKTEEDIQQEGNVEYVARTRSMDTLINVTPPAR